MSFFKAPPVIELHGAPLVAGEPFSVDVVLRCREPLPIDLVEVTLRGTATYAVPGHYAAYGIDDSSLARVQLLHLRYWPVRERVELAAAEHRFNVHGTIPAGLPGSFRGPRLTVDWRINVRVSVPWWLDARRTFFVAVRSPPVAQIAAPEPTVFASNPRGPAGRWPYAEVTLANTVVRAGDRIRGYLSLGNLQYHRYQLLIATLRQRVMLIGPLLPAHGVEPVATGRLALDPDACNAPIPFELHVPHALISAFQVRQLGMVWALQCTVHAQGGPKTMVEVPITIVPSDTAVAEAAPMLAAIGSERLGHAWSQAAVDTGFALQNGALVRRTPRCTLTVARQATADRGTCLVADARMAEVDIGLHVDDGQLRCRDPGHNRAIAAATDGLTRRHGAASANDQHIRFEFADGGTRRSAIVALARWSAVLVDTVLDVREQLPAPASAAYLEPAFEEAAELLGATFVAAGMDVWGRRDEVPFSLETRWSGAGHYHNTTLAVGSLIPIDSRYRGQFPMSALPAELPDGLAELLDGAEAITIVTHGVEIHFPATPEGEQATFDVHAMVARLEALIAIGLRLSMRDGVYR